MIEIRKALRTDFDSWAKMRFALWSGQSIAKHLMELEEAFGQKYFQGWMALNVGKPVGFAEASIRPFANGCDSSPVAFLEGIWVDPNFRRHHVGRDLVSQVEEWARSLNIFEVGSDTEISNTLSQACHENWGFEETERVVYYRKKLASIS